MCSIKDLLATQQVNKSRIREIQKEYSEATQQALQNKPLEVALYTEFKRANQGKQFISLKDIDGLGLPYDILLITSVKNTGKTTNIIYKLFKDYIKEGKKVLFMRTSEKELKDSVGEYNNSTLNPCYFKGGKIYEKGLNGEWTDNEVGRYVSFKFCQSIGGGDFSDYGAIFFDEFLSWDPVNRLRKEHYLNWGAFISTVTRNKPGIKIYCLGNLTGLNSGLLDYYGIKRDDSLRYISALSEDGITKTNLLYINVNDIYKGIKTQKGAVSMMSPEVKQKLFENECIYHHPQIIKPADFNQLEPLKNIIKGLKKESKIIPIVFEIRKGVDESKDLTVLAVRCRIYESFYDLVGPTYTSKAYIVNKNDQIKYTTDKNLEFTFDILCQYLQAGKLFFYDLNTCELMEVIYEEWKQKKKIYELL